MTAPCEHKTVQARILRYAPEIGWTFMPRDQFTKRIMPGTDWRVG